MQINHKKKEGGMNYADGQTYWHNKDCQSVIDELNSSLKGLSYSEVQKRLKEYGPNIIKGKKKESVLKLIWGQINNPLIWVLLGATLLAILLGNIVDGIVVLSVVVINTIIGFAQEYKAGKAIEALGDMVPNKATVIRNGETIMVSVSTLVPGDIVFLAAGDRVPADMRIIEQKNFQVDEAALTGESLPVQKSTNAVDVNSSIGDRTNMVYGGTLIISGTANAIVASTGKNTELGRISGMLEEAVDMVTPLGKKLALVGKYLTIGIVSMTLVILAIGTIRATEQGISLFQALEEAFIFGIAIAVGAIPEGLPAVVTIALAIGVQRMAKRNAIIRKLPAVETLGSTTVICSDKTGTLTRNEMTVAELWKPHEIVKVTGSGYNPEGGFIVGEKENHNLDEDFENLLKNAVLCSDSELYRLDGTWKITGDPTEGALVVVATKAGINCKKLREDFQRLDVMPFESENQFMATLNAFGSRNKIVIKGAPEVVMSLCAGYSATSANKNIKIAEEIERMGSKGMRVLAIAQKSVKEGVVEMKQESLEGGFFLTGLIGMIDPPRPEAIKAIEACNTAGIVVKMITGDHKSTAASIASSLGISESEKVITGSELLNIDDAELTKELRRTNVFARVSPEHKLRVVKALQNDGHIVAMTGDGVNDAPSLKQANIGVSMGITGTSVSKESADIVLADDNFSSIRAAVEEGRRVYDNLIKSLVFLLPTNLSLAFILMFGIMFFPLNMVTKEFMLPMLPVQLLWINLVAAVALALPLAFEAIEPDIMKRPPRKDNKLFNKFVVFRIIFVSGLMTAGAIILFNWEYSKYIEEGMQASDALKKAQTIAVSFVVLSQIFYLLNCRSLRETIMKIGVFSNKAIYWGIGIVLALQAIFVYSPFMQAIFGSMYLGVWEVLLATVFAFAIFVIITIEKQLANLLRRKDL